MSSIASLTTAAFRSTIEPSASGALARRSALRRFGTAEEVAELLAFCAGEKASYLTGIDVVCDGGYPAAVRIRDKLTMARES